MEWDIDNFSRKYSRTFKFLSVLERHGRLNRLSQRGNPKSKMAQLIEDQDQLKHEVEKLTMRLSGKEAEIAILKAELLTAHNEGPGSSVVQALERENAELKEKIIALHEKDIRDNDAANARLTLIIQSLSHPPPSS